MVRISAPQRQDEKYQSVHNLDSPLAPSPNPRGRPQVLDADHLLITAMRAYWHGDPADVSLNRICEMAGVSKPFVYRAFGNEDGLQRAALNSYAGEVLAEVFGILQAPRPLADTLAALVDFSCDAPSMETGCLFHKMRAGQHRLGPQTRALVADLTATALATIGGLLAQHPQAGALTYTQAAQYLVDQMGLAVTQRAGGMASADIRPMMELALSPLLA